MEYTTVRGMSDILPKDIAYWRLLEEEIRRVSFLFGFQEIRLPLVEYTDLFARGIGEETDVVHKEMYTFPDKKGRSLTLRPEATASVIRSYLEHGLDNTDPFQKLFYLGPMFRYEKPQKGRSRQFHQYGVEGIGSLDPSLDLEVISLAWQLMSSLGIGGLSLQLNSIGCSNDRDTYKRALRNFFADSIDSMCPDCQRRYEANPLRILDCKDGRCQDYICRAPGSVDCLCSECAAHFSKLLGFLDELDLDYDVNPRLIRGLDYYTRTVFELVSEDLGAQDALLGGGRYDDLAELLGGPPTPAVGFAGGMERLIIVMQNLDQQLGSKDRIDLFLATLGEDSRLAALSLAQELRQQGVAVELDYRERSLGKQVGYANSINARYLIVVGGNEISSGKANLKHMDTGEEQQIELVAEKIRLAV